MGRNKVEKDLYESESEDGSEYTGEDEDEDEDEYEDEATEEFTDEDEGSTEYTGEEDDEDDGEEGEGDTEYTGEDDEDEDEEGDTEYTGEDDDDDDEEGDTEYTGEDDEEEEGDTEYTGEDDEDDEEEEEGDTEYTGEDDDDEDENENEVDDSDVEADTEETAIGDGTTEYTEDDDEDDEETGEYEDDDDDDDDDENDDDEETGDDDGDETSDDGEVTEEFLDEPTGDDEKAHQRDIDFDADIEEGGVKGEDFGDVFRKEQERRRRSQMGPRLFAFCLCFCCLILVATAIVVALQVFVKDDDNDVSKQVFTLTPVRTAAPVEVQPSPAPVLPPTPVPTNPPTGATTAPTIQATQVPTSKPTDFPTMAPSQTNQPSQMFPEVITLEPFADTQINQDGYFSSVNFGSDDSFLVQKGIPDTKEAPDAIGLLVFDTSTVPLRQRVMDRNLGAVLELTHVASDLDRGVANLTVFRLPSTEEDIESWSGDSFAPPIVYGSAMFPVLPSDELVQVDVTDLFFTGEPLNGQFFIMIQNLSGPGQNSGDRFQTRESSSPPRLVLTFEPPPTTSPGPSSSNSPTTVPTSTSQPSAPTDPPVAEPTASYVPTTSPTRTSAPSMVESQPPTIDLPETITFSPLGDTQIDLDGFFRGTNLGQDPSFLIQNGIEGQNNSPDTIALLLFDTTTSSSIPILEDIPSDRNYQVLLELTHVPSFPNRPPADLTIVRLPNTADTDIESLTGETFVMPTSVYGNTTFTVAPADEKIAVDITSLIYGGTTTTSTTTSGSAEPLNGQLYLMIQNYGQEQTSGDRFESLQATSSTAAPKLIFNFEPLVVVV